MSNFWKKKPTMKNDISYQKYKIIDNDINSDTIEQYKLPNGYTWNTINIDNEDIVLIVNFLKEHYLSSKGSKFNIDYTIEYLKYRINNGYFITINNEKNIILGVVGITESKGYIYDEEHTFIEPCLLCVNKNCRMKGIAELLMNEVIRIGKDNNYKTGLFITEKNVVKPIGRVRYYSRPLNYKHLYNNEFMSIAIQDINIDEIHNKTKINLKPNKRYVIVGNTEENVNKIYDLYEEYTKSFFIRQKLTKDDIGRILLNENYCTTIFVKNDNGDVVDFISYLKYDVINTEKEEDNKIRCAKIFMYSSNKTNPELLFINVIKQMSFDKHHIVYIPDIMHSSDFILSKIKNADEDTDDEEENAVFQYNIIKTIKTEYMNMFNIELQNMKQNNISWLLF